MAAPWTESLSVEFKSDRKTISENVIVEEVVALSNTEGGDLYIGVEDNGEVTGVQAQHQDAIKMAALVANRTVPPVSVRPEILELDGLPVLHLEVPQSASIIATSSGRILRRRIKSDGKPASVPMYPFEITTRLSDLGRLDLTAQAVPDSTIDDFDPVELTHLRRIVEDSRNSDKSLLELSDEELRRALRLTTTVSDMEVPTLAGLLLVGKRASLERHVPTAGAAFQVLQGTDVRANTSFDTALLTTIEQLILAIEPWNPVTEVSLGGLFTDPVPAFDRRAIREAVVNAFGHRDYSVLGRVRVLIDDEGFSITNPGGFVEGITVKNLLTAEPGGRNPCLMDALKRVGLAERTGRGVDRIYQGSLAYGRPLPDYSESNARQVRLFIARSEPDESFVRLIVEGRERTGRQMSLQALLVLDCLKRLRRASATALEGETDLQPSRLRQTLEQLTEAGLVEASGQGRARTYMLGSRVYGAARKSVEYVRQTDIDRLRHEELILKLAEQSGRVTNSDVCNLLHVDSQAAYGALTRLVKAGKLEKRGKTRSSYYVAASNKGR